MSSKAEAVVNDKDQVKDPAQMPTADEFIAEKRIGERIKRLRLKKSMGLVELGRHTGLSASFLSQLETGRVVPTLRNLARIAMVFSKDLSYFFESEPSSLFRMHRKADRVRLPQHVDENPSFYFESLGYQVPDRQLDPYWAEFPVLKKGIEPRPHVHAGFEFLYVIAGSLEIKHADRIETVETGDAVYFDAATPHSYRCVSKEAAQAVIVTSQHMNQQPGVQAPGSVRPIGGPQPELSSRIAPNATNGTINGFGQSAQTKKPKVLDGPLFRPPVRKA